MNNKKFFTRVRTNAEVEIFANCAVNPFYFIGNFVKIVRINPAALIPFKLYPFQIVVLKCFLQYAWCVCLKPRQMGMSTLVCAYALWCALFKPHQKILLLSIKQSTATDLLRKIKLMYMELPECLQMEVINGEVSHNSQLKAGTATQMLFANGSEILAVPATEDAGRSAAVSLLIMDEAAHQRYASTIWSSVQPTLSTGGRAIVLSTAFGIGNFFHETWSKATQRLSKFFPIKLNWQMHPERDITWYNEQRALLGEKRCAQEVDCDFLKSGYTVFSTEAIRAIEDRLNIIQPVEVSEQGRLLLYELPKPNTKYFIGADISTGRSRDYSAFSIMRNVYSDNGIYIGGKEVGCFKAKVSTKELSALLMATGKKYNWATLAPEINGIGEAVISDIVEEGYPEIYYHTRRMDRKDKHMNAENKDNLVAGFQNGTKERKNIIIGLDNDLDTDEIEMNNPYFVQEGYTFIYNEQNKAIALGKSKGIAKAGFELFSEEAESAYTDDAIFGSGITNEIRKYHYQLRPETTVNFKGG